MPKLSIVIPTLNEAATIGELLAALRSFDRQATEIIVVDGGSHDGTVSLADDGADCVLVVEAGRARQMNAGAEVAKGWYLWFVHADTGVTLQAWQALQAVMDQGVPWGRFDIRLSGTQWAFRVIERCINARSRMTGIATGDQAIFVRRDCFVRLGGYAEMPLMEDVAFSKMMKTIGAPACLRERIISSSRRWEQHGIFKTIVLMWLLRWRYFLGCNPAELASLYSK